MNGLIHELNPDAWYEWHLYQKMSEQYPTSWHDRQHKLEPTCDENSWRTAQRDRVISISDMTVDHLKNCINVAKRLPGNKHKLLRLQAELEHRLQTELEHDHI